MHKIRKIFFPKRTSVVTIDDTSSPASSSVADWKTIAFFGGLCLLTNNITGPGMVQIPTMFQQSGWFFSTIFFVLMGIVSGIVSLFLAKAMQIVPGNRRLQNRMEFEDLAHKYLPNWLHIIGMIVLIFNFQATNISSIVISSQTMDSTLVQIFSKTCGLVMFPFKHGGFHCVDDSAAQDSPFGNEDYVISIGYIIVMAVTLPLGVFNLDDNIWVQKVGFSALSLCLLMWFIQFIVFSKLDTSRVPFIGDSVASGMTTVVFNYGFVITLPSWLNEKKEHVSIEKTVWAAVSVAIVYFLGLGFFGGMALDLPGSQDITSALTSHDSLNPNIILPSRIASYIFPFAALLTSIPVYSIIIRYNLMQHRWIGTITANLFAVVLPWVLALVFYVGDFLSSLINWSAAVLFVGLNFTLPLAIYLSVSRKRDRVNTELGRTPLLETRGSVGGTIQEANDDEELPLPHVMPAWTHISDRTAAIVLFIFSLVLGTFTIAVQIQQQV